MLDPKSDILHALYRMEPEEARRLAANAGGLTVWEASALGDAVRLAALLDGDPSIANAFAPDGHTPLGLACFFGATTAVQVLVERGADVNKAADNPMKVQPLHAAVAGKNVAAVALLLERGANPNARQQVGYTALMGAASAGSGEMADLLLRHGADPMLQNDEGKTAAAVALEHGHQALADRLAGIRA